MPVNTVLRFSCPITHLIVEVPQGEEAPGWFILNAEHYAPEAQLIIAGRISTAFAQGQLLSNEQILAPSTAAELQAVGIPVPEGVA